MTTSPLSYRSWSILSALLLVTTALSVVAAPASPALADINPADFQQVTLAKGVAETGEPMAMTVLPDRSVLHTARDGRLRRTDAAGNTSVIATIPVYTHDEEGLQGVAADPGFATNRYIYLYYAPPLNTPAGDAPASGTAATWATWAGVNRLSRFTLNSDFTVNAASEVRVLDVTTSRGICCHVGGDMDFDAAGNLYLSTGDDSNPFESAGYSPLDERAERNPAYDAQRSAGNTNDLRGKVLRIKVNPDGTYAVPAGNLFAPGTAGTRPEIYAMGFRNPFRMSVDKATGTVYLGDYGPDAGTTQADRGPSGQVEFNRITSAGNYGWPYCTGTNTSTETYNEWNFATNSTGPKFGCAAGATNNSAHNTGLGTLPPARPAWIRYADGRPGLPLRRGQPGHDEVPAVAVRQVLRRRVRPRLDQAGHRERGRLAGHDRHLPVDRQAGHGHGVRAGRLALRPRLRHRVLQRRRELGAVPLRLRGRRQPGSHRGGEREQDLRCGAAGRGVLVGGQQRSGGRRADLLVGVR
jgi:glucose/arabinose dehydrogenase